METLAFWICYFIARIAKKFQTEKSVFFLGKNDLVKKQPRQKWLLGKIIDLIPSQDGQIRGARVLLGKSRNTVDRPINRLYPLETDFKFVLKDSEQNKVHEVMKEGACRPKREVAELGKIRMRYTPGINWRGGSVKYSDTYLKYIIKHMCTVKLKSYWFS